MLQEVCKDVQGGGVWFFDAEKQRYGRKQPDGTCSAVIDGKFLPDPEFLWQKRAKALKVPLNSDLGARLRPTVTTFALWQHWENFNAQITH